MIELDDGDVLDLDLMNSLLHCQVCKNEFRDPLMLPCQHSFCKKCLEIQFQEKQEKSTRKIRAILCQTCQSSAIIPAGGVSNYPVSIGKIEIQLVIKQLLMQNIISRIGKPRYFSDRDRSHISVQTDAMYNNKYTDDNSSPVAPSSNDTIKNKIQVDNLNESINIGIQTEDCFTLADDCRSEPDGGSLGSQDVREEGVGESDDKYSASETWSITSDYFNKPNAVIISNDEKLIVSDYNEKSVSIYDMLNGEIIHQIENLRATSLVKYNKDSEILVADARNKVFSVYRYSDGEHLFNLNESITYETPGGMYVDENENLFIADRLTGKLMSYNRYSDNINYTRREGELQSQYKSAPYVSQNAGCQNSSAIACCVAVSEKSLYIACVESGRHRVVIYQEGGDVFQVIGEKGKNEGELLWPSSCCFFMKGEELQLLISDTENHRICLFSLTNKDFIFRKNILQSLSINPASLSISSPRLAVTSFNRMGKSKIALYNLCDE